MLAINKTAKMSHINKLARSLFEFSKEESDTNLLHVEEPVLLEIPFLNDYDMATPLDICLGVYDGSTTELCPATKQLFCSPRNFIKSLQKQDEDNEEDQQIESDEDDEGGELKREKKRVRVSSTNVILADVILENIQNYRLLHSSQSILDALILGTRLGLPNVKTYLESRIFQTDHKLLALSHPRIDSKYLKECTAIDGAYGTTTASIFGSVNDLKGGIFTNSGAKQPTRFETIDLPELFQQGNRGRAFIEALTECKDHEFFTQKSVQVLVDHHYHFWYKINLLSVGLPAFLQLILFWSWSNIILPIRMKTIETQDLDSVENFSNKVSLTYTLDATFNYGDLNALVKSLLFIVTLYLFCYDLTVLASSVWQFNRKNKAPRASIYNIFNLSLHLLVMSSVVGSNDDQITQSAFWQVQSWVALAVWLRIVVTYLGEIQQFNWLVGLIKYSCSSTVYFITVFVCFITAFTDAYNALDQKFLINGNKYDGKVSEKDLDVTFKALFN